MIFKDLVHLALIVTLILNPAQSIGASKEGRKPKATTTEVLKSAFVDPVPRVYGIEVFFGSTEGHTPEIIDLVLKNPDLKELVKKGEQTHANFMAYMIEQFGESVPFLLDPVQASIDLIQRQPPNQVKKADRPLREAEAARRAWYETEQLYGLQSAGIQFSDIDQQRNADPNAANIYDFYKRLYFKRLESESKQTELAEQNPESLRRRLINKLKELRLKNFNVLLSEIKPKDRLALEFASGKRIDLRGSEAPLLQVEAWQTKVTDHLGPYKMLWGKLGRRHQGYWLMSRESVKYSGNTNARKVADSLSSEAISIQFSHPDLAEVSLPILEMRRLVADLELVLSDRVEDRAVAVAIKDTVARDVRFQELQNMIDHAKWEDTTDLVRQLEQFRKGYFSKTEHSHDRPSMIQQTSKYADGRSALSPIDQLRWSGYRFGASYWKVRDEATEYRHGRKLLSQQLTTTQPDLSAVSGADTTGIKTAQLGRTGYFASWREWARTFMGIGLSTMLAANLPIASYIDRAGTALQEMITISSISPDLGVSWDVQDPTNHSESDSEKRKETAYFEVLNLSNCNVMCPKYISIPTMKDIKDAMEGFPESSRVMPLKLSDDWNQLLRELDRPDEHSQASLYWALDHPVPWLKEKAGYSDDEIVLKTLGQLHSIAMPVGDKVTFTLPLPVPSKHVINKILLLGLNYDLTTYVVNPNSYSVLVDPWTGMQFAHFHRQELNGPGARGTNIQRGLEQFRAVLSYKYNDQIKEPAADSKITQEVVGRISDKLLRSGLPYAAEQLLQKSPDSLSELSEVTNISSVYTYRPALAETNPFSEVDSFSYYQRFLIEGPTEPLFLQCTGASALTNDLINTAIRYGGLTNTRAERMQGFRFLPDTYDPGSNAVIRGPGHQWNVITKTDQPFQYMEVDGTPVRMDPKSGGIFEKFKSWLSGWFESAMQEVSPEKPAALEQPKAKVPAPKRPAVVRPEVALRPEPLRGVQPGPGWESHSRLDQKPRSTEASGAALTERKKLSSLERLVQAQEQYARSLSELRAGDPQMQFTEDPFVTRTLRLAAEAEGVLADTADAESLDLRLIRIYDRVSPKEKGPIVDRYLEHRLEEWLGSDISGTHPISKMLFQNSTELREHLQANTKSEDAVLWLSETSVSAAILQLAGILQEISSELADRAEGLAPGERCRELLQ